MKNHPDFRAYISCSLDTGILTWLRPGAGRNADLIAGYLCKNGYRCVEICSKTYKEHRLVWWFAHGIFPSKYIDHINGKKDDNRLVNLREATPSQNVMNQGMRIDNSSGFKGVSWHKPLNKFVAHGKIGGKQYHLGYFDQAGDASAAYEAFAKIHHGEFYNTEHSKNMKVFL